MYEPLISLLVKFDEMGFAPTVPCIDAEQRAMAWRDGVIKEIEKLEAENVALREMLEKCAKFALDYCGEDDGCGADDSVGISACPMWCEGDVDESGNFTQPYCKIKKWLAEDEKK